MFKAVLLVALCVAVVLTDAATMEAKLSRVARQMPQGGGNGGGRGGGNGGGRGRGPQAPGNMGPQGGFGQQGGMGMGPGGMGPGGFGMPDPANMMRAPEQMANSMMRGKRGVDEPMQVAQQMPQMPQPPQPPSMPRMVHN